jgi:putative transposase
LPGYAVSWDGGSLVLVPPQNTCGFQQNADWVGAINVLRAGHARCACEVSDADRQQQELAEAIQEPLRAA